MAVRILGQLPSASDLLSSLREKVVGVGPGASLVDKLSRAQAALDVGDSATTLSILRAFTNEVSAQAGLMIPADTAAALIQDAAQIRALLA